jgi:hypothetical protein
MEKEDGRYFSLILNIYMQTRMYLVIENNNSYNKYLSIEEPEKNI